MTHTGWNRFLVGGIAAIACCFALGACTVQDDAVEDVVVDEDAPMSEEEAYCGPEPHFVWNGSQCLPSCGAAGGNYCGGPGAFCYRENGWDQSLASWDCAVCCPNYGHQP